MNRRDFARLLALGAMAGAAPAPVSGQSSEEKPKAAGFSYAHVVNEARQLAKEAYRPVPEVDSNLRALSYDSYRDIRYKAEHQIWRGQERGFTLDLLHSGFVYRHNVEIFLVEDGVARHVPYNPELFDFGPLAQSARGTASPGYSGIRVRTALNDTEYLDEFAVFQGATYLRAVGQGQNYGLSARGLAIATAEPKGEEFPIFRRFWIERPKKYSKSIIVYALLDSPSATGAYQFEIFPGPATRMDVDVTLFARQNIERLGLAPLTSMFLFNLVSRRSFDDFRTAVHDSDGLLARRSNGEQIWRPLRNPTTLELSSFMDIDPAGFGLLQRARDIADFNDLEAHYERRPSAWVEPKGKWGTGEVVLVEIPTDSETNDNIVAFWRPKDPLNAGESMQFGYWLSWGPPPSNRNLAYVTSTLSGLALHGEGRVFIVDFAAGPHAPEALHEHIEPNVWASRGEIADIVGRFDVPTNRYRLSFRLLVGEGEPIELGGVLRKAGKPASETWLYRWTTA